MREGYCSCLVCQSVCLSVCVCVSVTALAASASIYIRKQRYTRVSRRLFLDFDSWIFEKTFRSKVMPWKRQYANELELTASTLFGPTKRSSYILEWQLVGGMLLQMLATAASGQRQAMLDEPPTVGQSLRVSAPLNVSAHVEIKDQRRACVEAVPCGFVDSWKVGWLTSLMYLACYLLL